MDLTQDKIELIEKIIKNNRKFASNEDLYDDFFNETCKRSLLVVKTVTSDTALEAYLKKIATTSILNVLKDSGRLRRSKLGYKATKEISLDTILPSNVPDYAHTKIVYEPVDIKESPEDALLKKDILQKIVDCVADIDEKEADKNFYKLYYLRYEKGMTQKEIAQELNISQSEVSKRLFKLIDKVKQTLRIY